MASDRNIIRGTPANVAGAVSGTGEFTHNDTTPPPAPSPLTASAASTEVTLHWAGHSDNRGSVTYLSAVNQ